MPAAQAGDPASRSAAPGAALRRLRLGLLLLNGVLASVFVYLVVSSRNHRLQEDEDHVRNVAQLMVLVIGEALDGPAALLESARKSLQRSLAEGRVDRDSLVHAVDANPGILDAAYRISIADQDGRRVCARSAARCQAIDVSDRDYFERLRAHPDDPIGLYGPYPSRVDGTEGLVLALALRGRGHDFAGVAVVVVPVKTLQRAVDQVELGTHGVASVRTADLRLVQHREDPAGSGKSAYLGPESALRKAVQAAPESGLYRATNDADAIERLVAYRRL
ncbi:MAG: hypothetical protein KGM91_06505, partial [Burkholderiales bacterium]|nr:hypothetical protein [Burkholderiales bacterium]